jgi:hypothetical protein
MALEQASGESHAIGPATDVYALGTILYEALTGQPPFEGANPLEILVQVTDHDPPPPRTLNPQVDRDLETICLKCLQKEPHDRYASAADLADDLHRYRSGELIHARSFTLVDRVARTLNRDDHVTRFHSLGTLMCIIAVIPLIVQVLTFVVWHQAANYGAIAVLIAMATITLMLALMVVAAWRRRLIDSTPGARHFWSIRIGHILGMLVVPVLFWQLATPDNPGSLLAVFPFWAAMTGVTFFPLGSNFWGRLYLFGLVFLVAAPVMALRLEWAPIEMGLLATVVLLVIGFHLRRLDRESRKVE